MKRIDPRLKNILQSFSAGWRAKREAAFRGLDFEDLRERLARVKDAALNRLEELRLEFEKNARRHGSFVLHARDSREANRLILDILRDHGLRTLVKGKSMVSEETGLNDFLLERRLRPRETDLGEWIVQLAGQGPSHMVLPAIHLSRQGVAEVFSRALQRDIPADIPTLVRTAREELRREIFGAGAGLTGANALIAENGSIMLVTNEGNGRLVTSVPAVHIVLASLEKLVPRVDDALLQLKLLTRNATGQHITSYVSFLAGPHHEAQYIILLDNRRSALLADPVFREVLRCIKCSACLNVCPVYQVIGGERFSHVYMGGIGSLLTAWTHGLEQARPLADLCLVCHRCDQVCAAKIGIAGLVRSLRERLSVRKGVPLWKKVVFGGIMASPRAHQRLMGAGHRARPAVSKKDGFARRLPLSLRKFDRFRSLPAPARKPLSAQFVRPEPADAKQAPKGCAILFAGCLVEHFYPEIGLDAVRVLGRLGYDVSLAPAQCCGYPAANAGFRKSAKRALDPLVQALAGDEAIVTLCPTCTTMLQTLGPELLGTPEARNVGRRVQAFSRFLLEREGERLERRAAARPHGLKLTYHDSCHHGFVLKAGRESRALLKRVTGVEVAEMGQPEACCGFAGSYAVSYPEISEALLRDKLEDIKSTGAGLVALDCPGCLLQIRGGCRRAGLDVDVRHTAEILARSLRT